MTRSSRSMITLISSWYEKDDRTTVVPLSISEVFKKIGFTILQPSGYGYQIILANQYHIIFKQNRKGSVSLRHF